MGKKEELAHGIQMAFGTGGGEPTSAQTDAIINELNRIKQTFHREPIKSEWADVVKKHCPTAGRYKYAGIDNSDLNALLAQATAIMATK